MTHVNVFRFAVGYSSFSICYFIHSFGMCVYSSVLYRFFLFFLRFSSYYFFLFFPFRFFSFNDFYCFSFCLSAFVGFLLQLLLLLFNILMMGFCCFYFLFFFFFCFSFNVCEWSYYCCCCFSCSHRLVDFRFFSQRATNNINESFTLRSYSFSFSLSVCVCVFICVCVFNKKQRGKRNNGFQVLFYFTYSCIISFFFSLNIIPFPFVFAKRYFVYFYTLSYSLSSSSLSSSYSITFFVFFFLLWLLLFLLLILLASVFPQSVHFGCILKTKMNANGFLTFVRSIYYIYGSYSSS